MAVFSGNGAVGSPSFTFSSDTNTGMYRPAADELALVTGGSNKIYIDSTGVGINGIASPGVALDVNGEMRGRYRMNGVVITKGVVSSGTVENFTLDSDVAHIKVIHSSTIGSTRTYTANFNSGVPTTVGTILHLEIDSYRENTEGVSRGHQTTIQFNGVDILTTGYRVLTAALPFYNRHLTRSIILTLDGWKDLGTRGSQYETEADDVVFYTPEFDDTQPTGAQNDYTEKLRLTSGPTTYLRMASGTDGIQFNGDTANANALDDYEEGDWTPGGISTTGTGLVFGKYIRVGSQVTAWVSLVTSSGTLTLPTVVTGLPYARATARHFIGGSWGLYTVTGTSYQAGATMTATNLSGFVPVGAPASSVIDGFGAYLSMMVTYTVLS